MAGDQPTTYTSNTLTPQASQMQSLVNSITAMPAGSAPSPQQAQSAALPAYNTMEANQGQNQANVQQQLTDQTISPLMKQYSDMIPAFQMYQADQNLAGKYMN